MQRFLNALTNKRTLLVIGLIVLAVLLFAGAVGLDIPLIWPIAVFGIVLAVVLIVWIVRRIAARRANRKLGDMLEQQAQVEPASAPAVGKPAEIEALRTRLVDAVKTIKTSKIG